MKNSILIIFLFLTLNLSGQKIEVFHYQEDTAIKLTIQVTDTTFDVYSGKTLLYGLTGRTVIEQGVKAFVTDESTIYFHPKVVVEVYDRTTLPLIFIIDKTK